MKRKTLKFMACAVVMALTLSVTACGGSDDGAKNDTVNVEEDAADSQEEENTEPEVEDTTGAEDTSGTETEDAADTGSDAADETDAGDDEYFETLEEAFADPEVKAAMDEQFGSMDMDGMEFSYEVKGNDFIAIYKVLDTVIDDPDDFAEQMEPVMDQLGAVFSLIPEAFDEAIGKEGATSVVVRFLDANDTLLIERSYKAQ